MMRTLTKGTYYPTLFTNVALNTDTNEPWWEGMDGETPKNLLDWQAKPWNTNKKARAMRALIYSKFIEFIFCFCVFGHACQNVIRIYVCILLTEGKGRAKDKDQN
jgi:GTP-dependent phosphoenolpyruvate carboxykinase